MRRKSFRSWPCSIARTADLLGDAWTLLVLRELFYGETRFDGFVARLGIPRNTLTDRLGLLVDRGLLQRQGTEYALTEMGRDAFGVLAVLHTWGEKWLSDEAGPPVQIRHESCGHDLGAVVACGACEQPVRAEDISVRPGPGFPAKLAWRAT